MNNQVRVRFAPSPTGHLHIGSWRTALFNILFARHYGGKFLVRIEDTDRERSKDEYVASILDSLAWAGFTADEPLVVQTERTPEHVQALHQLMQEGKVYKCYCTAQEVRVRTGASDEYQKYDGHCRNLPGDYHSTGEGAHKAHVLRFKLPADQKTVSFEDHIRGTVTFDMDQLDDFVLARSDGTPMYNFVVVVDDIFMRITHIIRGEDHIPNTPKQVLLYHALGSTPPEFAHLPLILGPDGNRLSKRDAAVSVLDYKASGFLASALINYMVRLGWSHGDQEIFTWDELVQYFSFDHVGKKGAIFDKDKLSWINGQHLHKKSGQEILQLIVRDVDPAFVDKIALWNQEQIIALIELYKDRSATLLDIAVALQALSCMPTEYQQESLVQWVNDDTVSHLSLIIENLESLSSFTLASVEEGIKQVAKTLQVKLGAVAQPIRIALTGTSSSPSVWVLLDVIGKKESIQRLKHLQSFLQKR